MTIWEFSARVSQRLLTWAAASFGLGLLMLLGSKFWRGVASQFMGWAVINAAIGWFGQRGTLSRREKLGAQADAQPVMAGEATKLWRLLWINAGLDILYILGGLSFARRSREDDRKRGIGIGIAVQGAFLFVFDIWHGLIVPRHKPASAVMPVYSNGRRETHAEAVHGEG